MSALAVGTMIGPWRVTGALGDVTYTAERQDGSGKVLLRHLVDADPGRVGEVRPILLRLEHPNLARCLDLVESEGRVYVVMERVEALSLRRRVLSGRVPPSEPDVLYWTAQICDVLEYLHGHGLVVRDLDPSLVLVSEDNHVWLTEVASSRLSRKVRAIDPRVDVYAVGALMYFALTRMRVPEAQVRLFQGTDERLAPLSEVNPEVTVRTEMGVEKLLEMEPSRRPADIAAVRDVMGLRPITQRLAWEMAEEAVADAARAAAVVAQPQPDASPADAPPSLSVPATETFRGRPLAVDGIPAQPVVVDLAATPAPSPRPRAAARGDDRPVSYAFATCVLYAILISSAAWALRLIYMESDSVRVTPRRHTAHASSRRPLAHPTPEVVEGDEPVIIGKDGAPMVRVEGGKVRMGADDDSDASPSRKVQVDAFYIDRSEVSFRQFKSFVERTGYLARGPWQQYMDSDHLDRPVVGVTYEDARRYCEHFDMRLPTEAQWERAARGGDERRWPWGSTPGRDLAVTVESGKAAQDVGTFPQGASPCGALHMAGNVWEWTSSPYRAYPSGTAHNRLMDAGMLALRGGAWSFPLDMASTYSRMPMAPSMWGADIGFRGIWTPDD